MKIEITRGTNNNPSMIERIPLKERDNQFMQIQQLIDAKRELLEKKQKKLKEIQKQNQFLGVIRDDYRKYQNYITLQKLAKINLQTFLGVCPGKLTDTVCNTRSQQLIDLLETSSIINGGFYAFDQTTQNFKLFNYPETFQ
jgi:hypothetical protein